MNNRSNKHWILKSLFGFLILLTLSLPAWAAPLKVQLNRNKIMSGETVVLSIDLPKNAKAQPDLSPLQKDFAILGTGNSSQTQIINGVRSDKHQLNITLQPRTQGELTVPALTIGNEQTTPLKLTVAAAPTIKSTQAGSPVWLELETPLKKHNAVVQQEIPLTVRLYSAIPLNNLSLTTPTPQNAIVEKLGKDSQYQAKKNGQQYQVVEQHYVVFPEVPGDLTIPPIVLNATTPDPNQRQQRGGSGRGIFDDPFFRGSLGNSSIQDLFNDPFFGGGGKRVSLQSNPIKFSVKPIPAAAKGKTWLPAHDVSLTDSWQNRQPSSSSGEPVSLSITVKADGLTGSQIPAITFPSVAGKYRVYTESTDTENYTDGTHLIGTSIQNFTLIPESSGQLEIPEIKLDWWNIDTNTLHTATLAARTVNVAVGTGQPAITKPKPASSSSANSAKINQTLNGQSATANTAQNTGTTQTQSKALYWLAGLLLFAFLGWATQWLLKRKRMGQSGIKTYPVSQPGLHNPNRTQAQIKENPTNNSAQLEAIKKAFFEACKTNNPEAAATNLIRWAQQAWHDESIFSLLDLAKKVEHGRDEIHDLYHYLYQSRDLEDDNHVWQGEKIKKAVAGGLNRKQTLLKEKTEKQLPPLYPDE